jgi:hypothetical protein
MWDGKEEEKRRKEKGGVRESLLYIFVTSARK